MESSTPESVFSFIVQGDNKVERVKDLVNIVTADGRAREHKEKGKFRYFQSHGLSAAFYSGKDDPAQPGSLISFRETINNRGLHYSCQDQLDTMESKGFIGVHFISIKEDIRSFLNGKIDNLNLAKTFAQGMVDLSSALETNSFPPDTIIFAATNQKMANVCRGYGFHEVADTGPSDPDPTIYISMTLAEAVAQRPRLQRILKDRPLV